jgi:hypothetical protein
VCRTGGIAALLLVVYSIGTLVQLLVLGGPPATADDAFRVLQENRLVGLLRLDLPTAVALPLYYLVFLGLLAALKDEEPARAVIATLLAFAGLTLVLAAPGALAMLALGDRFAAATTAEARQQLLAAGEAVLASDMWHGTGAFVGAVLLQSGAVLISAVMLRTNAFSRTTGYVGLSTHGLDLAHVLLGPFLPAAGNVLMAAAGPLYLVWLPLVGIRLLRLGRVRGRLP